jgi:hypothetical protein
MTVRVAGSQHNFVYEGDGSFLVHQSGALYVLNAQQERIGAHAPGTWNYVYDDVLARPKVEEQK